MNVDMAEMSGRLVIIIVYREDGAEKKLIVLPDQLFLMSDKRLRAARDLWSSGSFLMSADGKPVTVLSVSEGGYPGSLYMMGIGDVRVPPDLNGHLFIANGVVTADLYIEEQFGSLERKSE